MAVELRWVVPSATSTERPRLQYRNWGEWPAGAGPWTDVPTVVEEAETPKPEPTCLSAVRVAITPGVAAAVAEAAAAARGVPAAFEPCGKCRNRERCEERGCMDKAMSAPAPGGRGTSNHQGEGR